MRFGRLGSIETGCLENIYIIIILLIFIIFITKLLLCKYRLQ